ncbi:hypothetical protein BDW72DRAFT_167280 [Aspergillus terricola var. indicus]
MGCICIVLSCSTRLCPRFCILVIGWTVLASLLLHSGDCMLAALAYACHDYQRSRSGVYPWP